MYTWRTVHFLQKPHLLSQVFYCLNDNKENENKRYISNLPYFKKKKKQLKEKTGVFKQTKQ